jgi:hypothetical protein
MSIGLFGMNFLKFNESENNSTVTSIEKVSITGFMIVGRYFSKDDEWYFFVNDKSGNPLKHINMLKSNNDYTIGGLSNAKFINLRRDCPDYENYTNNGIDEIPIIRPIYKGDKIKILELLPPYNTYDQDRKEYWAKIEYNY